MAVIKYREDELDMLARLLRAEAEGEGELGMLLVGNVGVNRVRVDCSDFKNIRTLNQMIYQSPGGFEAVQKPYFYQKARERDKRIARRAVNGERAWPGKFSLWYFRPDGNCPPQWWGQPFSGKHKLHCFYEPKSGECDAIYNTY